MLRAPSPMQCVDVAHAVGPAELHLGVLDRAGRTGEVSEIVADVEKNYDITIAEDELPDLTNLKAVYDKVQQKLSEAS